MQILGVRVGAMQGRSPLIMPVDRHRYEPCKCLAALAAGAGPRGPTGDRAVGMASAGGNFGSRAGSSTSRFVPRVDVAGNDVEGRAVPFAVGHAHGRSGGGRLRGQWRACRPAGRRSCRLRRKGRLVRCPDASDYLASAHGAGIQTSTRSPCAAGGTEGSDRPPRPGVQFLCRRAGRSTTSQLSRARGKVPNSASTTYGR